MHFKPISKRVTDSEDSMEFHEEKEAFLPADENPLPLKQKTATPWILLAIIQTLLSISMMIYICFQSKAKFPSSFPTDLVDARKSIDYEITTYSGALVYDPRRKLVVRVKDSEVEYFGPPSEELEKAWDGLLRGEFPVMTASEARPFLPELKPMNDGEFHFEPAMFHSLHCVNEIRTFMAPMLYPNVSTHSHHEIHGVPPGWDLAHMEHCMDQLRQVVMCHGDLSPSPMYRWRGFNIALGRMGEHTCRKFGPIRDWMDERGKIGEPHL